MSRIKLFAILPILITGLALSLAAPATAGDATVRDIQTLLAKLGYDPGPADGVFGKGTQTALDQFLTKQHIVLKRTSSSKRLQKALALLRQASRDTGLARSSKQPGDGILPLEVNVSNPGPHPNWHPHVSADGRYIAIAAGTGVQLWDAQKKLLIRDFKGLPGSSVGIAIAPDGKSIAAATRGIVDIWDTRTGKLIRWFSPVDILNISFTGDSRHFLMISGDKKKSEFIYEWNLNDNSIKKIYKFTGYLFNLSTSSNNKIAFDISSGVDKNYIYIIDINGKPLRKLPVVCDPYSIGDEPDGAIGTNNSIDKIYFSNDEKYISAICNTSGEKIIWDIESGKVISHLGDHIHFAANAIPPHDMSWSPDDREIALVDGKTLSLWDWRNQKIVKSITYDEHRKVFGASVNYLSNGGGILVNALQTFDSDTLKLKSTFRPISASLASSDSISDRVFLSSGDSQTAYSFDTDSGKLSQIFSFHDPYVWRAVSVSSDGTHAAARTSQTAAGEGATKIVTTDAANPSSLRTLLSSSEGIYSPPAVSPDGRLLAVGGRTQLSLIDFRTGKAIKAFDIPKCCRLKFSNDSSRLLFHQEVGDVNNYRTNIGLIDLKTMTIFAKVNDIEGVLTSDSWSKDDSSILVVTNKDIEIRRSSDLKLIHKYAKPEGIDTSAAGAWFPDGKRVVVGSGSGKLYVLNAESGGTIETLVGHAATTGQVRVVDGGKRILSVADDGIKLWDVSAGKLLATFVLSPQGWITITPEGFFDAPPHGGGVISLVRGLDVYSIDQVYQALYRPDLVAAKLAGDPEGKVKAAAAKLDLEKVIDSGAAPKVAFTSPDEGTSVDADSVSVSAAITDEGGGIGKVEWRVNGVTLGVDSRGFDRLSAANTGAGSGAGGSGRTITVTRTLSLDPGDNHIEVVAYNARGLIASEPVELNVKWAGATASTPPNLYVLAVGINDYWDSRLKLNYAATDAKAIATAFKRSGRGLYQAVDVTTVLDGDATKTRLGAVFDKLSQQVRPRDVFILFMAGHGKTQDGRYYFLPQDFRYVDASSIAKEGIDQDTFQLWLSKIKARKSVLLYDTCDSGSLTHAGLASRGLERVTALARMTRAMGRTVLSASTDDTPALEGYRGHGVFTYALLSAIGKADENKDGMIEVTELAGAIDKSVPTISYAAFKFRQVPQMSIVGSDFPLTDKLAVLASAAAQQPPAAALTQTVPPKPTHVVILPAEIHQAADAAAPVVTTLAPGTQVTLIETANGWTLVSRNGKRLGYLQAKLLAQMQ